MKYILAIIWSALCFISGYDFAQRHASPRVVEITDTIVRVDTFTSAPDTIYAEKYIGDKLVKVEIHDTLHNWLHDTIEVALPFTQREYMDSTYHVWVSGHQPALDSIMVFPRTITINNTRTIREKTSRWGLFGGASVGIGKYGVQPYVGIGVGYKII